MENFKADEECMNQLLNIVSQMDSELADAHGRLKKLLSDIEGSNSWKGKSRDTFMAYMGLMEQYHASLAFGGSTQPVNQAVEALKGFMAQTDTFYAEFGSYKTLEED